MRRTRGREQAGWCHTRGAGAQLGDSHHIHIGNFTRLAHRRCGLAGLHRLQIVFIGVVPKQNIVKHTPRNGGGLGRTEACVFNHQRQSDLRVFSRRKSGVERVVAQMLFELGGVVLFFLAD